MQQIVIDNRICNVHAKGENAPVFIYVNAPSIPVGAKQIVEAFEKINNKVDKLSQKDNFSPIMIESRL